LQKASPQLTLQNQILFKSMIKMPKLLLKSLKRSKKLNHLHRLMKIQIILKMRMTNQKMNQMMKPKKFNLSRLKKKLHQMMKKMKSKLHQMMKKVKKMMKPYLMMKKVKKMMKLHLMTKKMTKLSLIMRKMKNLSPFLNLNPMMHII